MTTTQTRPLTDPATLVFDGERFIARNGEARDYNPESRVASALADRMRGMTWGEVAALHGYRTAAAAEANVGRYVAWINGHRATRRPAVSMSTRRYGVEIEFVGCTMAAAARSIAAALQAEFGAHRSCEATGGYHSRRSWDEWRVEYDGSVTSRRTGRGGEAVSPVLSGPEGLAEIKVVMGAIKAVGGSVRVTCGIHVHLDATDLSGEQIARMMVAYDDRQDTFDRLVSPSRRSTAYHAYVGRLRDSEKVAVVDSLKATRSPGYAAQRYRNVNVTCLGRTGTVEFRQHQGSLNARKVGAWITMLLALSESVVATADENLPMDGADFIESLTAHGLARSDARYLTGRMAEAA